ncbi:MAG: DUF389 domain-containing protein [Nostocaceae cyanobacterium]|nr:DUF389 domain-containing protein [Nostocaceae cyanobacterium]
MTKLTRTNNTNINWVSRCRDWFSDNLGISEIRKEEIYCDLLRSVTLRDISYWLQVIFAAGIATLGLVINSPAVIIGAMLISPLMGTILANGLAFAAGDLVLGLRAIINLTLSCLVAITFAFILVGILPFKELTSEIVARTRPNVLDLVIALFSGALAAVATCKEPKGVVTSIPGVAIAVALMPPLCVVGYGIGIAASLNWLDGLQIARGGGLLFLTNLAAITLMAMVVFLLVHIDTSNVRSQVRDWHRTNTESHRIQSLLEKFPASNRLKVIGSLPSRFIVILFPVLTLLVPLSQSLTQLQKEIIQKQENTQILKLGTEIWREKFSTFPDGTPRSDIDNFLTQTKDGKLVMQARVFTSKLYTPEEKKEFIRTVATHLGKNPDDIGLQLIEIPTASSDIIAKLAVNNTTSQQLREPPQPPNVAETQIAFLQTTSAALQGLKLPAPAQLLNYEVKTSSVEPLGINLIYFSEREIDRDAKNLLIEDIRNRLNFPTAKVNLQRIAVSQGEVIFANDSIELPTASNQLLDKVGKILQQQRELQLELITDSVVNSDSFIPQRVTAIKKYLANKWQISEKQIVHIQQQSKDKEQPRNIRLKLKYPVISKPIT